MADDHEDDEPLVLSGSALDALKEFYADRDAHYKQFEDLKAAAEDNAAPLSMDAFAEDWNESQFWYSDETALALAEELLEGAGKETTIAVVSAPSVFVQVKNILAKSGKTEEERPKLYLLEFDQRFEVFPEFVFYDFNNPLDLPPSMKGSVDKIICDPPFLSDDCQTKAALTVRWLSKSWDTAPASDLRVIVCTGERMETLINKLYRPAGVSTTTFEPVHSKGLSNEFFCYANFECQKWKWRQQSSDEIPPA
ncbi:Protein-lysine N-methyltransferase EFM5 [Lachnellula cervina]|uniref:Protein-lysine N-methyltransferase EFM5 n=1 Tax=Lachnellula cervina TaxID=1316786 RepID=A0A7D8YUQ4_9HELO|nr:Protein-lysine N-methyltransferase EFM5 [Lachnellula cervina]